MNNITNQVTDLDFDGIKSQLIAYLSAQSEFTDYDFEGSNLSTIMNILAYNTHYNAVLTNAAFNETFLDTALKRSSVVSRANEFGYVPRSKQSAQATVSILLKNNLLQTPVVTIPEFFQFTTSYNGTTYSFYTVDSYSASAQNVWEYSFPSVVLHEGSKVTNSITAVGDPAQKFVIPNGDVDISTIRVYVKDSSGSSAKTKFVRYSDITQTLSTSLVYYLEQNSGGKYQLYFGDGVISKALLAGNVVMITYLVSSGTSANTSSLYAQNFAISGLPYGADGTATVSTISSSSGAGDAETIDEIRYNSRLSFERQNRIVTANDYSSYILENYAAVKSVNVYGGENANPPVYGKVFLSVQPKSNTTISDTLKTEISTYLKEYSSIGIYPEFVDPDYVYLNLNVQIKRNSDLNSVLNGDLQTLVIANIQTYFDQSISLFKKNFYYSKLISTITDTDASILSAYVSMKVQKRIYPVLSALITEKIYFGLPIVKGTIFSNVFYVAINGVTYSGVLADDGLGDLNVLNYSTNSIILTNVGTVDYSSNMMTIDNLVVTAFGSGETSIKISATPQNSNIDITPSVNQILVIDDSSYSSDSGTAAGLTVSIADET
jgi:hypothetical protein